jgi:hypothetical protein
MGLVALDCAYNVDQVVHQFTVYTIWVEETEVCGTLLCMALLHGGFHRGVKCLEQIVFVGKDVVMRTHFGERINNLFGKCKLLRHCIIHEKGNEFLAFNWERLHCVTGGTWCNGLCGVVNFFMRWLDDKN